MGQQRYEGVQELLTQVFLSALLLCCAIPPVSVQCCIQGDESGGIVNALPLPTHPSFSHQSTTPHHTQIERRLSSDEAPPDHAQVDKGPRERPPSPQQSPPPLPSSAALEHEGGGGAAASTPTPSSSSSSPSLSAATGEAFFADAMRRAVATQQWAIAARLHGLALACGAVTGASRRLDLYMYGGAVAAAKGMGKAEEVEGLVEVRYGRGREVG